VVESATRWERTVPAESLRTADTVAALHRTAWICGHHHDAWREHRATLTEVY